VGPKGSALLGKGKPKLTSRLKAQGKKKRRTLDAAGGGYGRTGTSCGAEGGRDGKQKTAPQVGCTGFQLPAGGWKRDDRWGKDWKWGGIAAG